MKCKLDFVTNSSSTSFIVMGVSISLEDLRKQDKFMELEFNRNSGDCKTLQEFKEKGLGAGDLLDHIWDNKLLSVDTGVYGDSDPSIGAPPHNMKDDETLANFKQRVVSELALHGIEVKIEDLGWIQDCYYDG